MCWVIYCKWLFYWVSVLLRLSRAILKELKTAAIRALMSHCSSSTLLKCACSRFFAYVGRGAECIHACPWDAEEVHWVPWSRSYRNVPCEWWELSSWELRKDRRHSTSEPRFQPCCLLYLILKILKAFWQKLRQSGLWILSPITKSINKIDYPFVE